MVILLKSEDNLTSVSLSDSSSSCFDRFNVPLSVKSSLLQSNNDGYPTFGILLLLRRILIPSGGSFFWLSVWDPVSLNF